MVFTPHMRVKNIPMPRVSINAGLWCLLLTIYGACASRPVEWIVSEVGVLSWRLIGLGFFVLLIGSMWRLGRPSRLVAFWPLVLILACAAGSIWTYPLLQQLSASFALMGLYGFAAGLARMTSGLWRKGLLIAALSALALPFALVPGTGAGFYLRLLTADAAAGLLEVMGHASLGAHDVLIFDNGIAQVDIPCSGLKSLFTGTGFFLALSLVWRRYVSVKWILAYAVFVGLLLVANTVRVTLLIWISEIMQARALAETIHTPIGLVLFAFVCIAGIVMLRMVPAFDVLETKQNVSLGANHRALILSCAAITALGGMAVYKPAPLEANMTALTLPQDIQVNIVPLTPTETRFFAARELTQAHKWMFSYKGLSGSMLVVRSSAANGLHAPEVCLLGNGISVQSMETRSLGVGDGAPRNYRWLTVDDNRRNALYWMQNDDFVTDDFGKRLSKYTLENRREWTMVTLLMDRRLNQTSKLGEALDDEAAVSDLMTKIQAHFGANIDDDV